MIRLFASAFLIVALQQATTFPDVKAQQQLAQEKNAEILKLLISLEQPSIASPSPARLALHLHNSGPEPLWLYRRVSNRSQDASSLRIRLEPQGDVQSTTPADGVVLESAGLPSPKLVRLNPGEDYQEKIAVQLSPALASANGEGKPIWDHYRLVVTYTAQFTNAEEIARNLGATIWQGETTSNTVELQLLGSAATAQGSVAGRVVGSDGRPVREALVSLSDREERVVNQVITGGDGLFSFIHLPLGLYWITARRPSSSLDNAVFRHVELTSAEPAGSIELMMLPKEIYEAKGVLHKPVLFRVMDSAGRPLDKVALEATWSNGPVLDNVKGQVSDDGTLALELIPGRNFITLKRRGCPKQEDRVDVTEGPGIEGFKLVFDCTRK